MITWYDSADATNRRKAVVYDNNSIFIAERAHPSDLWPPQTKVSDRPVRSVLTAQAFANSHGCTHREEDHGQ